MRSITEFGAVGDGRADDTGAVQATIDACHADGGGRVVIPTGGTFRCGTIALRSGIELHLEAGATLQASPDDADYTMRRATGGLSNGSPGEDPELSTMFITAVDARDVSITGAGTIDGGGRFFITSDLGGIYEMTHVRPYTIFLIGCERVTIRDVRIVDGAYWTVRLSGCSSVLIDAVTIANDLLLPNNDGIDIDTCQRVRIANCDIVTADDGICIKSCQESKEFGECSDITVTGCTIVSRSAAICIGSEIASPIRNCVVSACVISDSNRGLALKLSEPGGVHNVLFTDIVVETRFCDERFWGHGEPIHISSYPWRGGSGTARNIRFHNILARGENGILIRSEEAGCIEGVVLSDVRVEIDRWTGAPGGHWDLRPLPGMSLTPHATSGIHLERLTDVRLANCEVVWAQPRADRAQDLDEALTVVDVDDLRVADMRGGHAHT
ncbi:MAG: glycosyl hydrolase family 28 protein [Actinomycetota bacterium]|nr:glycosyl hydrolase family 28 protein [Actinomycetota bacterium]